MNISKNYLSSLTSIILILSTITFQSIKAQSCVNLVYPTFFTIEASGGGDFVYVDPSNCESFVVNSTESWISPWVDYIENTIGFSVEPNTTTNYRTGYIIVDENFQITINQEAGSGCTLPDNPGAISGTDSVCAGGTSAYSISPVSGATLYHWYIDGIIVASQWSNSANITFGSASSQVTLSVRPYNDCGESDASSMEINILFAPSSGGSISGTGTICANSDMPVISNSAYPSGDSGSYSYQWQSSTDGYNWNDIGGATSVSYNHGILSTPTGFRRKAIDSNGCGSAYSNILNVNFYPSLSGGAIAGNNTTCYQYASGNITNSASPSGGSGSYTYTWQKSTDSGGSWTDAGGSGLTFDPFMLTTTTWYRRRVTDGCGAVAYSNNVIKTVRAQLNAGIITSDETLCYNEDAGLITGSAASGGTGSYIYSWEKSEDDGYTWSFVQDSSYSFDPDNLLITTQYKRVVTDAVCGTVYSNSVIKTVKILSPGIIAGDQTINYDTPPSIISNVEVSSGTFGTYSYQWQISNDEINWSIIQGETQLEYNPGSLLSTRYFRRSVTDICGTAYSNEVAKTWAFSEVVYLTGQDIPDPDTRQTDTLLPVGSTIGNISTTQLGGLSYSIPIFASPGTNGVQPSVAVQYNSQSGNGLLGWGWNLTGLSSISRIIKPYYVNQEVKGINMDSGDELALDGNRLVFDQGTSTYHTELETFSEITAHGTSGDGPEWFKVSMKDSSVYEYGRDIDGYISNNQSTRLIWYLTKFKDVHDNYIKYNYTRDQNSGQILLSSIQYTGNENASLDPYNEIVFKYATRSDSYSQFQAGIQMSNNMIITEIICLNEGNMVKKYSFGYIYNLYSKLASITEFSGSNSNINSTIFKYNEESTNSSGYSYLSTNGPHYFYYGDYNGDGKSDIIIIPDKGSGNYTVNDKIKLYINLDGTNFTFANELPIYSTDIPLDSIIYKDHIPYPVTSSSFDIQGDGLLDFYTCLQVYVDNDDDGHPETWKNLNGYYMYSKSENELTYFASNFMDIDERLLTGDFDGDGYTDRLFYKLNKTSYSIYRTTSIEPGWNSSISYGNIPEGIKFTEKAGTGDFNGNGKADIYMISADNYFHVYEALNNQLIEIMDSLYFTYARYTIGDINGDGKTDIYADNYNEHRLFFSGGKSFNPVDFLPAYNPTSDSKFNIDDLNGDGKGDLCQEVVSWESVWDEETQQYLDSFTTKMYLYMFNGIGFTSDEVILHTSHSNDHDVYFADLCGDGQVEVIYREREPDYSYLSYFLRIRPDNKSRLLKTIADGFNNISRVTYGCLPESTAYLTSSDSCSFPVRKLNLPVYFVESIKHYGNGESTPFSNKSYAYQVLKVHIQGKGILGFSKITSVDSVSKARIESCYGLEPARHIVFPDKTRQYQNNVFISETTDTIAVHSYNGGERYFSYNPGSITENKLNGTKVQVSTVIDQSGNMTGKTIYYKSQGGSTVKQVTEAYGSFDNFGNPGAISVISTRGLESITRSKNIFYNLETGSIDSVVQVFTGTPSIITTFDYDIFGNIISENTICGDRSRNVTMVYETGKGRFLKSKTNALNHSVFHRYDPATGNILKDSTHNGIVTSYQYDDFGNLTTSQTSVMPAVNTVREWSQNAEGIGETFSETVISQNNPAKKTYYDFSGRELRSKTQSFDGTFLVTDKEYDGRGRLKRSYLPYFEGSDRDQFIEYTYDSINRILTETKVPGNIITGYTYYDSELKTKLTRGSQDYYNENDASGLLFRATDPGGSIIYRYNAEDKVDSIISPSGITRITYDPYGYQDELHDIDAGTIDYDYNGLGELIMQTDEKGNRSVMAYDVLGRITQKSREGEAMPGYEIPPPNPVPRGESRVNNFLYTYDYDPDNELIKRIASPGGAQIFSYDNLNRLLTNTDSVGGSLYTAAWSYNPQGKIDTVVYNSSVAVANNYNNLGYLDEIKVNNQTIWNANSMNRYGAINSFTLGNQAATTIDHDSYGFIDSILTVRNGSCIQKWGYEFNAATGNLTGRTGLNTSGEMMQEAFTYDDLNRLTSFITEDTVSISYEASGKGNIESKSDVGDYDYTGGLHDVRYIRDPTPIMLSLPKHEAEYTRFNKISYLRDSISAREERRLYLTYGPDDQRVRTVYMINNDTIKTKYFALGNYEKEIDQEENIRELYYISSPSGLTAILQKSGSQDSIFYVHTDYLGSYDVITTATGTIRQRYNFDPWGRRRNPMDWSYNTDSTALLFDRGFTGHEHLDQFGLINMNGRVYDPLLAMFLSPDNYVQAPDFTQNFNRYAYCLNNPLNYTDPDGEWVITALITLGNMWLNGAMVNNFQFNPAKWDWSSPKTWVGLGQSTFLGWQMGTRFETKIKANRFWKGYDRAVKMDDISIQETGETKLPDDYDLYGFQKTHFPKYTHRNKVNMLYDNEIVKSQAEQGKLPPMAFTSSQLVNDKYQIYFGEAAFRSQGHLYLSMGHEFIHVAHFERFGALFNKNMSEYAAYIWNAGYLNSRGYSEWGVFKESALKWGNYDLSRNGSFLKIEPYLILKQNNYGLPFFNYYNLFN